jgi:hypothetical protein
LFKPIQFERNQGEGRKRRFERHWTFQVLRRFEFCKPSRKTSGVEEKAMEQKKTGRPDKGRMGDKPGLDKGADRGLTGQDTDGDGKVVKPGQKPGQSHGHGSARSSSVDGRGAA